jgi:hypothetical protein
LAISQDAASGKFESKEIKFQLKVASEGKSTKKSLAGCSYDVACLNLSALGHTGVSSETREISLSTGKSAAAAAIRAITLEATFHYEFLQDDFDISVEQSRSRETSPDARSQFPIHTGTSPTGDTMRSPLPMSSSTTQSSMVISSQQPDIHAEPETFVEQEHEDSGDISSQPAPIQEHPRIPPANLEARGRAQSSPVQSTKLPKTPKKKFQWFKKVKGLKQNLTKYTPSVTSKVVQPSSSTVSDTDQSITNSSVESTGAVHEGVTQSDKMDTKPSPMRDIEEPQPVETAVPPKPKRSAHRVIAANTIVSPDPQADTLVHSENTPDEKSSPSPLLRDSIQEVSSDELHVSVTKPLPVELSTSVSSESSADDRTRSYSAPSPATKKQLTNNRTSLPPTDDHTERNAKGQSNVVPKRYRPPAPPTIQTRGLSKHISGSTPHLTPAKLAHAQRFSSVSHLAYEERKGPKPAISDLIKPTALASRSHSSEGCRDAATESSGDQHFGILKVRLKALDTSETFQSQSSSGENEPIKAAKEGLCCVFTIGGGNGRFTSSVQPLIPHRTTTWDDEEMIFYATPHSRKLFVLCQKTHQQSTTAARSPTESKLSTQVSKLQDRCVGAAVLKISTVEIRSCYPTDNICDYLSHIGSEDYKLPVQPKGTVLLQSCLCVLQPRFKVSCTGTVTIQTLSGLHCNSDHHLSCTVKIDADFQDDTNPQPVEQCVRNGWTDELLEFTACNNVDCSIQIWAYSSEETAHWCGGCLVPLAMLFPDEEVHRHTARGNMAAVCTLSTQVEKTITLPVEPKGIIGLSFSLAPSNCSHEHTPVGEHTALSLQSDPPEEEASTHPTDHDHSPCLEPGQAPSDPGQLQPPKVTLSKTGSLRRTTIKKTGSFNLRGIYACLFKSGLT